MPSSEDFLTEQDVEKLIDQRFEKYKQERMRNQRMINSLQEEVDALRNRVDGSSDEKKGNRQKIELEHTVMRAVASEIKRSRRNVADSDAVVDRVSSEEGELRYFVRAKIDELVEDDMLIEQSSGDLVFMDPAFEDIDFLNEKYENSLG